MSNLVEIEIKACMEASFEDHYFCFSGIYFSPHAVQ